MSISRREFSVSAVAASLAGWQAPTETRTLRSRSKLLILLAAKQFRSDYLDRVERALVAGGFRRLMEEGAFYPDCRFAASTFTSSGLATLSTGAYPEVHGIVADSWYDRATRKPVAARPEALEATTLADQVAVDRRARIFAVGMDEPHVSFLAGRFPTLMFFMDSNGQMVSRGVEASWLEAYQRARPLEDLHNAKWLALGAGPDTAPLRTLKYDAERPQEFFLLYKSSPFGQAAEFELFRELIVRERLGQGETFDVLFVTLGATALLGYEVGSDSPLMQQMVLHLDRQIEFTLDMLNKTVGAGNYSLVFTAAHGAPREPDSAHRAQMAIAGEAVASAINRALSERFDVSGLKNAYVEKYLYPFLYLRLEQLRRRDIDLRRARVTTGQLALQVPGVAGYYTADGDSSHMGDWLRHFRNSFHAVRSGDVMLSYRPDAVEEYGTGRGVSYGSLYNYDARVPLFLYGPQFRAQVFERAVEAVDIAPTLARAAGLSMPSSSTGRVLGEAFAETARPKK